MTTNQTLRLSSHDELYIIDLERVLFMQADDHYTQITYASGSTFMVPFGLARIEERIAEMEGVRDFLLRLGRKYIVNIKRIFRINTAREMLQLSDDHGENLSIHISKPVLRSLIDMLRAGDGEQESS